MPSKARELLLFMGIFNGVITACLGLETQHSNHLGWALLFSGTAFTIIGCLYLGALSLTAGRESQPRDPGLWLPCLGALAISLVTPLEYLFLPPVLPRSDHNQDVGLILCAGGLVFYLRALHGTEPWKLPARRTRQNRLRLFSNIKQMVLSPISSSLLLFVLGLGIGFSSWVGLLVIVLLVLPGLFRWVDTQNGPAYVPR